MAAKEESVILKYLKKNPGSEALDISFGTDIDESVVKETLQQLLGKQQVSESVSDSGISTWNIATPPPPAPKAAAPKPEPTPKPVREAAPVDDLDLSESDAPASKGGAGKGFVVLIALLFAAISAGATFFLMQGTISSAKTQLINDNKRVTDSLSTLIQATNVKISGLELEVKALKAPPADEKAEDPKAKGAKAAKPAPKKGKKGK